MIDRIKRITDKTLKGEIYIEHTDTEYDRTDLFLPPVLMNAKHAKEYILNQKPYISEDMAFTGYLRWRGNVMGDFFQRWGHKNFAEGQAAFYAKPIDGTFTFDWQHSVIDFEKIIKIGINGYKAEIAESKKNHTDKDELIFLDALDMIADGIIGWGEKCSSAALEASEKTEDTEAKARLKKLAETIKRVPANPAESFYEAVLAIYVAFAFNQDSISTLDRFLYTFYVKDKEAGILSDEEASAYLQELFLMIQFRKKIDGWDEFTRGGECHFVVGGYLPNGEDGFTELSKLILDSLLELPTWCPEVSLRWTKKTSPEVFKYVMECERKDAHKRIAFVNDEPRIKAFMEIGGFPFEKACGYTMVGCNEPQLAGGAFMSGSKTNIVKAVESTIYNRTDDICGAESFQDFYKVFEEELFELIDKAMEIHNSYQRIRARDVNLVSTMFFEGCIERAKSVTQGGAKNCLSDLCFIGITTVIDSLSVIKQFVFDEKKLTMSELVTALQNNWVGYEDLRLDIKKNGSFFGNGDETSDKCASLFAESVTAYLKGKKSELGYNHIVGNLIGYVQHHKMFGDETRATPDGRASGDVISFGMGQTDGKDREGLSALLSSIAKMDNYPMFCGESVTNILLDEQLVKNDDNFEKLVTLLETYFKMGGLHFQLTYVSKEDLEAARVSPEKYKSLRVRVSGFSEYFVRLNDDLQQDVIKRTSKAK